MKGKSALQGEGFRSPYQKLSDEQQKQLAEAIRADVLRQYGLIAPGICCLRRSFYWYGS